MKFSFVVPTLSRRSAGLHAAIQPLCEELIGRGAEVCVFGALNSAEAEVGGTWGAVPIKGFPIGGPISYGFQNGLTAELRRFNPDLVHAIGLWQYPALAAHMWAIETRGAYSIAPHGMLDAWALSQSRTRKVLAAALYERWNLGRASFIQALCESERASIRAFGIRTPVAVVPNGVSLPSPSLLGEPLWRPAVSGHRKILLFLGRIHHKKGIKELIHAWADAKRLSPHLLASWVLVIAGWSDSAESAAMGQLVEKLELSSDVYFVGPQFGEEKARTFQAASGFILPSYSEGLPMAVLEAWSHRIPTLITRECNLPEAVHCGGAFLIENVPKILAKQLIEFFEMSDDERVQIGARAHQLVRREFTWAAVADRMLQLCTWVKGAGCRPSFVEL